ncbi:MAG: hypothetical protein AAB037_01860, partial [Chloroflexota bacterium]
MPVIEEAPKTPTSAAVPPTKPASKSTTCVTGPLLTSADSTFEIPPSIQIVSPQGKLTQDEIAEAISELTNAAGAALGGPDFLNPPYP